MVRIYIQLHATPVIVWLFTPGISITNQLGGAASCRFIGLGPNAEELRQLRQLRKVLSSLIQADLVNPTCPNLR